MELVDFSDKFFHEIPEQDNPAFWEQECYMLVREYDKGPHFQGNLRVALLHIKPDPIEAVKHIAVFWKKEDAIQYHKNLIENFALWAIFKTCCNCIHNRPGILYGCETQKHINLSGHCNQANHRWERGES